MSNEITQDSLDIPYWPINDETLTRFTVEQPEPGIAVKQLIEKADELLSEKPESVTYKSPVPPSGDKKDYMSLAIYVWPNPEKPDGLPYIHKDGLINPEIHEYDLPRLWRTSSHVEILALTAMYLRNLKYAEKAARHLRTWFLDEKTGMNPHLNFGQFVPGECDGRCYGIIETNRFLRVINAVRLLESIPGYDYKDGSAIRKWFEQYARWLQFSELGRQESQITNNHRMWHTVQVATYLLFCDQDSAAKQLLQQTVPDIIEQQMEPDGSLPRELGRTRSYHYSVFALMPLIICAEIGRRLDIDLTSITSTNGGSIRKGVDFLLPYITGEKQWTWQEIVEEDPLDNTYPLLRMAANVLDYPDCEAVLQQVAGDEYDQLMLYLVLPAKYHE